MVQFTNGTCVALKTKPDGNCMFSALAHQLFGRDIESSQHMNNTKMLRQQAVEFLKSNLHMQRYRTLLNERLQEFPQFLTGNIDNEYKALLSHISKQNVWGEMNVS